VKSGIVEIDELTLREISRLPIVDLEEAPGSQLIGWTCLGFLDHPVFDVQYGVILYFGDFGLYRASPVYHALIPRRGSLQ
jgi:hypothetical protein